jgi:hypothetical protein
MQRSKKDLDGGWKELAEVIDSLILAMLSNRQLTAP